MNKILFIKTIMINFHILWLWFIFINHTFGACTFFSTNFGGAVADFLSVLYLYRISPGVWILSANAFLPTSSAVSIHYWSCFSIKALFTSKSSYKILPNLWTDLIKAGNPPHPAATYFIFIADSIIGFPFTSSLIIPGRALASSANFFNLS